MRVQGLSALNAMAQISNGGYLEPKATQSLADAIRKLVLCDQGHIDDKLRRFSEMGVRYVAILPSHEGDVENENLVKLVDNFLDY
jgi:hypothetical protein